jgi:hypothetical protein
MKGENSSSARRARAGGRVTPRLCCCDGSPRGTMPPRTASLGRLRHEEVAALLRISPLHPQLGVLLPDAPARPGHSHPMLQPTRAQSDLPGKRELNEDGSMSSRAIPQGPAEGKGAMTTRFLAGSGAQEARIRAGEAYALVVVAPPRRTCLSRVRWWWSPGRALRGEPPIGGRGRLRRPALPAASRLTTPRCCVRRR